MVLAPVAIAMETRWWPSCTKYRSPMRYTSIGGIASPRRWARASRSHRSLTRPVVGRNRRSKSRVESTVPTTEFSWMVCRPSRRSLRNPRAATTSSNGMMTLTSSGSRRSRWASRASTWWRRARRKSSSTSARGKPVAAGMVTRRVPEAGARLDVKKMPSHDVAHQGPPQLMVSDRRPVRVDMAVQQQGRLKPCDEPVERAEPLMRRVLGVARALRWCVGEQHVDATPVAHPAPPGPAGQATGPARLLPLGVLVRAFAVAAGAAEPADAQPGHVNHPLLRADRALGPRWPGRQPGPQRQPGPRDVVAGDVGVVVAGHEHQWHVERVHQVTQVVKGEVAARDDEPCLAHGPDVRAERLIDLVGYREDHDHIPMVCRSPVDARRRGPHLDTRVPAALASRYVLRLGHE